ncbi:uncharacterized protein K460DRAFT_431062 [Cucurbitaria berberidis CBS 394.84]|uniref:CFEM domain-containing protein n=1 Tax=Cucurbitaria berberidis CBS 394.84 TaxID=1168544 RepID=A0A9P4GH67_9PLEO|nr:uncharacterized protein K460DRAFT_431062 [Cucurbitaria berberidis CBS 394.84]KAF1846063.1 hypothetical protein K460DRAFT_431062 [Cucurbitaria berberidis CBS 394.84]
MRFSTVLTVLCGFILSVHAQEALQALAKEMPKCALACFTLEVPKSTCARNLTSACMCTNTALNAAVGACAMKSCTRYELLQTKNVSSKSCGVPIRNNSKKFIVLGTAGAIVAIVAFILRLLASLGKRGRKLSWDDLTMGLVVALSIPPAVFIPYLVKNGLGRDMWTLKDYEITNTLYYFFLGEIFYVLALAISKISILFFYLRVFPAKEFRLKIYAVMGVCVAYTIAFFFATTLQCIPVSMAWNQWDGLHKGRCNDIHLQGWVAAAINIVLDAWVMILPLNNLARLNMKLKQKLMVMSMFSVGIIVVFTSAMRLYSLVHFANSKNVTWDYVEAGYWSLLEIDVSIVCGCMPALRLLVSMTMPKIRMTFNSSRGDSQISKLTNNKSNGTDTNKSVNISIKPKSGDESDFVPLVDLESSNDRALANDSHSNLERKEQPGHSMKESVSNERLDGWPMATATMGKEHI